MINAAILASGNGTNAESLIIKSNSIGIDIKSVVTNNKNAGVIKKSEKYGVQVFVADHKTHKTREDHESYILQYLKNINVSVVLLAGYMRVLTNLFISKFNNCILNIHPADTNIHQGINGYKWALDNKLDNTISTVHLVTEDLDKGSIIMQGNIPVEPGDTLEQLTQRGLLVENTLYPEAVKYFIDYIYEK